MVKIGTHNSGTGEASRTIFDALLIPFAKCQTKTIKEQYDAGCRWFDLRAKMVKGELMIAHGIWTSKRTFSSVIKEINSFNEPCVINIMYEGSFAKDFGKNDYTESQWLALTEGIYGNYSNIILAYSSVKKPTIKVLWTNPMVTIPCVSKYVGISKENHTRWLVCPYLWKIWKYPNPEFSTDVFTIVDFL